MTSTGRTRAERLPPVGDRQRAPDARMVLLEDAVDDVPTRLHDGRHATGITIVRGTAGASQGCRSTSHRYARSSFDPERGSKISPSMAAL